MPKDEFPLDLWLASSYVGSCRSGQGEICNDHLSGLFRLKKGLLPTVDLASLVFGCLEKLAKLDISQFGDLFWWSVILLMKQVFLGCPSST